MITDEELMERFCGGDSDAGGELVLRHAEKLLRFVRWAAPEQRESAEDIVQEVFAKVCKNPSSFKAASSFRTWLYGVARLTALDWRRNFFRRLGISVRVDSENDFAEVAAPPEAETPERAVDAEKVRQAIERLPGKLKTVLLLREWEDMSYEEIADSLDLPVGTVRSRLHNARAALADMLRGN